MDFHRTILKFFLQSMLVEKMRNLKRRYGKALTKLSIYPDQVEITILEICIEIAQERIFGLKEEKEV